MKHPRSGKAWSWAISAPAPERRRRWWLQQSFLSWCAPWFRVADGPISPGRHWRLWKRLRCLIVGGADTAVIDLNRRAMAHLQCEKELQIIPGATHLFEEQGALKKVAELARDWFLKKLR